MAVTGKKPAKAERQFAKLARQTCGGLALHSGNTIKGQPKVGFREKFCNKNERRKKCVKYGFGY